MCHQPLETVRALSSGSEGHEQEGGRQANVHRESEEEKQLVTVSVNRFYVSGETCGWGQLCRKQEVNQETSDWLYQVYLLLWFQKEAQIF